MTQPAHRRRDIYDAVWKKHEPHLHGRKGSWGAIANDNRLFINAVFWIMRTGTHWRGLPPDFGGWSNMHCRFIRWRDNVVWERLLEHLIDVPDFEWLMIDASHCKVHPHAAGARGGNQDMSRAKVGSTQNCIWPWIRMVCRSGPLLYKAQQRTVLTTQAIALINGFTAGNLLADKSYDTDAIFEQADKLG